MLKHIAIKMINKYQSSGGGKKLFKIDCCFTPTCSQYTKEAITKYGFWFGTYLGLKRICRCKDSGMNIEYDPVPEKKGCKNVK